MPPMIPEGPEPTNPQQAASLKITLLVVAAMVFFVFLVMAALNGLASLSGTNSSSDTRQSEVIAPEWYKRLY